MTTQPPPESAEPAPVVIKTECWCERCKSSVSWLGTRMSICPSCGNKRCPRAEWHGFVCSGSNETGQVGVPAPVATDTQAQPATPAPAGDAEVSHADAVVDRCFVPVLYTKHALGGDTGCEFRVATDAVVQEHPVYRSLEARQQQAERDVVERWKGANGYNDLLQAYGAAIDERNRLRNTLPATEPEDPTCSGEWLSGSGGHRQFGGCGRAAVWVEHGTGAAFCDEHGPTFRDPAEVERLRAALSETNNRLQLASESNDLACAKLEAAERKLAAVAPFVKRFGFSNVLKGDPAPPDQAPTAKPFTADDVVKAVARAVIAEVAERANSLDDWDEAALLKLAKAAKEESGG